MATEVREARRSNRWATLETASLMLVRALSFFLALVALLLLAVDRAADDWLFPLLPLGALLVFGAASLVVAMRRERRERGRTA